MRSVRSAQRVRKKIPAFNCQNPTLAAVTAEAYRSCARNEQPCRGSVTSPMPAKTAYAPVPGLGKKDKGARLRKARLLMYSPETLPYVARARYQHRCPMSVRRKIFFLRSQPHKSVSGRICRTASCQINATP